MIKYALIFIIVTYILRKFIFTPIPGSQRSEEHKIRNQKDTEYSDYEEVD
jgi:hypothetical protein